MVHTVIKRDGREEPFSAEKLVNWTEWASVYGCNWSEVLKNAFNKLPDVCKSKDLHEALIKACIDKEDEAHVLMAGRLYMGSVYKQCFGSIDAIPTLLEFYKEMVSLGYWSDMGYSDEELIKFNSLLDHERDLELSYPQAKQIVGKYSIKNRATGQLFETPQFSYMRMALGSCVGESVEQRAKDVPNFFKQFSGAINCPTPDWSNLGTNNKGTASCCLFTSGDSIDSLAASDHIGFKMTAASAGLGSMLLTRSAGDPIRGGIVKHNGKLPYLRLKQEVARANMQGARAGAETTSICCLDPEIMDLVNARNPKTVDSKKVDGIDYSFSVNDFFVEKVAKDEEWMLISYYYAKDLWEAFFDKTTDRFDLLYEKYLNATDIPKTIIKARDLALLHIQNEQELGRQYETSITEINRHTPLKEVIHHSNLCVAPETKILTRDGYTVISEVEGESLDIWNGEEWSEVRVIKTGENQKLLTVTTSAGQSLDCTEYHKWYVFDGYGKPCSVRRTHELKEGDKLIKFDLPVIEGSRDLKFAYDNGFYSGDGCCIAGNPYIYLYHEKMELANYLPSVTKFNYQEPNNRMLGKARGLKEKFFVPSDEYTITSRLEWLAGYLDADGCVYRNGSNEALTACSISLEFLQEVQLMLQTLGVSCKISKMSDEGYRQLPANDGSGEMKDYFCQTSYRLLVTSYDTYKLYSLGLKTNRLTVSLRRPQRDAKQFNKVVSVVDNGRVDDTFCFTEQKRGMGMFNGLLTGQCQEILEHTRPYKGVWELYEYKETSGEIALCTLASTVPDKIGLVVGDGKFTQDTIQRYEETCYYALKKIDNSIENMEYPFPNLAYTAKRRRYAGVGITGLAYELALKGLKYSTPEGKRYMHMLAELHMYSLIRASLRLSYERGVCEWMDRTLWPEGWLPIDTYNKNVDKIVDSTLNLDWEGLRAEVIRNGGHRFSLLAAFMPTESSSIASNRPNSLYPIREKVLIKGDGENAKIFIAPESDRLDYERAWDIPTKDIIDMYAIWQKFTDQGISADIWMHRTNFEKVTPRFSAKDMLYDWLYAKHMGVKSRYYTNTQNSGDREYGKEVIADTTTCVGGACEV